MLLQLLTQIMLLHLFISSSSGALVNSSENGVCVSKKGKLPNMCNAFHGKTCCSASSRMLSASSALQNLATHGEASKDCMYLFELLECSICHPDVGTQSSPLRICDRLFEACSDAYFSTSDASNQVMVPCGASNGTICEKVSKWGTNGTAFCEAVGFTVDQTSDDSSNKPCCGRNSSFGTVVKSLMKTENVAWFQDVKMLVRDMTLFQQFSWVLTLIVLGTMLFNRWRYQQQMRAMIKKIAQEHEWEDLHSL